MFLWLCLTPLLLISAAEECSRMSRLNVGHSIMGTSPEVKLHLFSRENLTCGTRLSHSNLSEQPRLNLSRPSTFIIHGYRPTGSIPRWLDRFVELLLDRADLNVIVVDWNRGATNVNYFKSVENTKTVAHNLTVFIQRMEEHGASMSDIHLIGVSLGAHISGYVGAELNGSIGRITGLDAAGPLFRSRGPDERLDPTDAQFVDVLHTDVDALGFREPLGHVDFYANGGTDQPGCTRNIFAGGSFFKCDHQRSVFLFLSSLQQTCDLTLFPCSSYADYLDGKCLSCDRFGALGCPVFGYDVIRWKDVLVSLKQTNIFFTTNAQTPYCTSGYKVDVVTWNTNNQSGYLTFKLHHNGTEATAKINHKTAKFQKYVGTRLFAQFDQEVAPVDTVSVTYSTANVLKPRYKLRVLRIRLTRLQATDRPLCRYDLVLEENKEVTFRPVPCEESNF